MANSVCVGEASQREPTRAMETKKDQQQCVITPNRDAAGKTSFSTTIINGSAPITMLVKRVGEHVM
eukprot:gene10806-2888_t